MVKWEGKSSQKYPLKRTQALWPSKRGSEVDAVSHTAARCKALKIVCIEPRITTHLSAWCSELHHHLLHSHRRGSRTPTPVYAPSHTWSGCICAALQGGWFVCRRSAVLSNTISSSIDAATAAKIDTPTKHELLKLQFTVTGETTKAHRPMRYIK